MPNTKLIFSELDYNLKKELKPILWDTAMEEYGTIRITGEQFNTLYSKVEEIIKEKIISFYKGFCVVEPEFSNEDIKKYYCDNVTPIS